MLNFIKDNKSLRDTNKKLEEEMEELMIERRTLKKQVSDLEVKREEEVENLKLKQKIADEDIKHMQKMQDDRNEIAHEKKIALIEKEADEKVLKIKLEHADALLDVSNKVGNDATKMVETLTEGLTKSLAGKFQSKT